MHKLLLGSDPELFLTRDGIPFPACGLIGGTKDRARTVPHGGVLEDNVMLEYIHDPADSLEAWLHSHRRMLSSCEGIASAVGMGVDLIRSSYEFRSEILDYFGGQARQFGCVPDFNAYTGRKNPRPTADSNLRTCAGHIHFGSDELASLTFEQKREVVYYLDHVVGRYCVYNDPDLTRMQRYGQAGAFRPKEYGLEYRVPSNFWLRDDTVMSEIYDKCVQAYNMWLNQVDIPEPEDIQREINEKGGVV